MSSALCIILFVVFAAAQLLCTKKAAHKVIQYIPMLISVLGGVFAIGLHIYARIAYSMGAVSERVLAENQYFAAFILIPAGICLIGAVVGFLIGKKLKSLFRICACADCAARFFARWRQNFAGGLAPVEKFGRYMAENMQASCVRTDLKQALSKLLFAGLLSIMDNSLINYFDKKETAIYQHER